MVQEAPVSVRLSKDLRERIDQARGEEPRNAWVVRACERALRTGYPDGLERIADNELAAAQETVEARQRIEGPPPLNRIPATAQEVKAQLHERGIHVIPEGAEPVIEGALVDAVTGEVVVLGGREGDPIPVELRLVGSMWHWRLPDGQSGSAPFKRDAQNDAKREAYPRAVSFDG